jgi:hypothetical protein
MECELVLQSLIGLLDGSGAVAVYLFEASGVKGSDNDYLFLPSVRLLLLYFLHYNYYISN